MGQTISSPKDCTPSPKLPIELLHAIIVVAISLPRAASTSPTPIRPEFPIKAPWNSVSGFATASKAFRDIALQHWFKSIIIRQERDWGVIKHWPCLTKWVREIHILETAINVDSPQNVLLQFPHLTSASIDAHNDYKINEQTGYQYQTPASILPSTLQKLEVTNSHGPDAQIIWNAVQQCPGLESLCLGRCTMFNRPGCEYWHNFPYDHDAYFSNQGVTEYAHAIGGELMQLTHLRTLHLGIYLTSTDAIATHKNYHGYRLARFTRNTWAKSCYQCETDFLAETEDSEVAASEALAQHLPSLQTIEWASFFTPGRTGSHVYRLNRQQGRISVESAGFRTCT